MPNPIINGSDAVAQGGLPPELVGKSAVEISHYYSERESTILENARRLVSEARQNPGQQQQPPVQRTPPSKEEFWNDPNRSVQDIIRNEGVSREEFNRVANAAQSSLVSAARITASEGKMDWKRWEPKVTAIMKDMPIENQMDASMWTTAYFNVRGQNLDTVVTESVTRAINPIENPSSPASIPAAPRTLSSEEIRVIDGMGITPDLYRNAEDNMRDNKFPLTLSNVRGR